MEIFASVLNYIKDKNTAICVRRHCIRQLMESPNHSPHAQQNHYPPRRSLLSFGVYTSTRASNGIITLIFGEAKEGLRLLLRSLIPSFVFRMRGRR
ncbi:hypothetical protein CEXT_34871 [Caerostris extrusa]|uniref:Uncharacterized protein n=1 Tax=Caerostris extrusa TaxID=172846 RepID=A0AAV4MCR3_CAEEX|nr:hypothetical protein CEXT_34871 [Caerostris extrusa]